MSTVIVYLQRGEEEQSEIEEEHKKKETSFIFLDFGFLSLSDIGNDENEIRQTKTWYNKGADRKV